MTAGAEAPPSAAGTPATPQTDAAGDRRRFIPFTKAELIDLICADGRLAAGDVAKFRAFCEVLQGLYHFRFHAKLEALKEDYFPFNPDLDTQTRRRFDDAALQKHEEGLVAKFKEILDDANFEQISEDDIRRAMEEASLFDLKLRVNFRDFDSQLLFWRGESKKRVKVRRLLVLKREVEVSVYDRVVLLIKFKGKDYFEKRKRKALAFEPSSMVLKLFKNIPKADLEMLFPNVEVLMRKKDLLMLGVPGVAGGVGMVLKAGAAILAGIGIISIVAKSYLFDTTPSYPTPQEMAQIIAALLAMGGLGGYLFRQWNAYKNRKMLFMKALADNLYFKNLDNNAGVFFHVIDAAEEEECKEAILAYYFLLLFPGGLTERALDAEIESWLEKRHGVRVDFEVEDALMKLRDAALLTAGAGPGAVFRAPPIDEACRRLDKIWDEIFPYNK